jgi:hypothetical protein
MLSSALYLQDPLDNLCTNEKHNTVAKSSLRWLKLSRKEWDIVKDLDRVLGVRQQSLAAYLFTDR